MPWYNFAARRIRNSQTEIHIQGHILKVLCFLSEATVTGACKILALTSDRRTSKNFTYFILKHFTRSMVVTDSWMGIVNKKPFLYSLNGQL